MNQQKNTAIAALNILSAPDGMRPQCLDVLESDVLNYIATLEQENAELKAEVEALKPYKDNHTDLMNHMAVHDSEVIEKFINEVSDQRGYAVEGWDTCWVVDVKDMENYVQQLRQSQVTK